MPPGARWRAALLAVLSYRVARPRTPCCRQSSSRSDGATCRLPPPRPAALYGWPCLGCPQGAPHRQLSEQPSPSQACSAEHSRAGCSAGAPPLYSRGSVPVAGGRAPGSRSLHQCRDRCQPAAAASHHWPLAPLLPQRLSGEARQSSRSRYAKIRIAPEGLEHPLHHAAGAQRSGPTDCSVPEAGG